MNQSFVLRRDKLVERGNTMLWDILPALKGWRSRYSRCVTLSIRHLDLCKWRRHLSKIKDIWPHLARNPYCRYIEGFNLKTSRTARYFRNHWWPCFVAVDITYQPATIQRRPFSENGTHIASARHTPSRVTFIYVWVPYLQITETRMVPNIVAVLEA